MPATALFAAVRTNDPNKITAALRSGANINGTDAHGRTAIIVACMYGHEKAFGILLRGGASLDVRDSMGRDANDYLAAWRERRSETARMLKAAILRTIIIGVAMRRDLHSDR